MKRRLEIGRARRGGGGWRGKVWIARLSMNKKLKWMQVMQNDIIFDGIVGRSLDFENFILL
jgi:hypothetical protein